MKTAMGLCILAIVLIAGCSFLNKIAPSQFDNQGVPIPGTHELIQPIKNVTDNIPYATPITGMLLLAWNFFEQYKKNKAQKGLFATIAAIEKAGEEPEIKDAIAKLKEELSHAHDIANVQPLIKEMLAKL